MLNQLYLDQTFDGAKDILLELKKKLSGYKTQDINKKLYDLLDASRLYVFKSQIVDAKRFE